MTGWFAFAVAALLLMGVQRFLYKVAAERSCDTVITTMSFMATVTVISAAAYFARGAVTLDPGPLLLIGLVNSLAFLAATFAHIEALKRLSAAMVYPLVRLDAVLVVIISLVFFHERLADRQMAGVAVAVLASLLVARHGGGSRFPGPPASKGFLFVAMAILGGTVAAISSRAAVRHTDIAAFMTVSYGLSTVFSLLSGNRLRLGGPAGKAGVSLLIGLSMGILNVAGYFAYLQGLSRGPLSLVTVITGMHFVVAVLFSVLFYREKVSAGRLGGIVLAAVSLVLIRT